MARYALMAIVVCGVIAWFTISGARQLLPAASAVLSVPQGALAMPAEPLIRAPAAEVPSEVTLRGTVVIDATAGAPGIPYIAYADERGRLATKQLVFEGGRGCRADAGDLPCVPSLVSEYPRLSAGDRITVSGLVNADRFLVRDLVVE